MATQTMLVYVVQNAAACTGSVLQTTTQSCTANNPILSQMVLAVESLNHLAHSTAEGPTTVNLW